MNVSVSAFAALLLGFSGNLAESGTASACHNVPHRGASAVEIDQSYAERVIGILRAALSNNVGLLRTSVAPHARFELWRGDYSSSARHHGPRGAIEFVRDLQPAGIQLTSVRHGPRLIMAADCR